MRPYRFTRKTLLLCHPAGEKRQTHHGYGDRIHRDRERRQEQRDQSSASSIASTLSAPRMVIVDRLIACGNTWSA